MDKDQLGKRIMQEAFLEGDFTLRSGKKSKYYLDKYLFETQPDILDALGDHLKSRLPSLNFFDKLAGPELGAVSLVSVLSIKCGKPFVIVRKGQKDYATGKLVEGKVEAGERIVMIEDILTTAGAAIEAAKKLNHLGVEVLTILGVIDREQGARANVEEAGYQMDALFTKTELGIK